MMTHTSNCLVVDRITRQYDAPNGPVVLRELSLTVPSAQTVAIIGPSGSGKSTLLNIIGSLDRPSSGTVRWGDTVVTELFEADVAQYRSRQVGFVFQDHHLLPQLTALENVLLPTLANRTCSDGQTETDRALALLDRVGLWGRAGAFPGQLSGGERQRVAVCRAMVNSPSLLLCDEPTGNLDQDSASSIVNMLLDLANQQRVTVLMVTHNQALASRMSRQLRLAGGTLVSDEGGVA
jgi:lipoprotein-releasing system ATP-binding protein